MAKLVCDRCGAPAVTSREYSFSRAIQWAMIILFTIVLGLAARQVIKHQEVVPLSTEPSIRV